jgi:hypothetical protein
LDECCDRWIGCVDIPMQDSATTVSISFTTRFFNFEKILLQDIWNVLKPFKIDHFGEAAEFYVCFSDVESLVEAYHSINEKPIGKYFTLNMELTGSCLLNYFILFLS